MPFTLALDQSTSGTKAARLDAALRLSHKASRPHRQGYPQPGHVEHDAEEIFANTLHVLRTAIGDAAPGEIAALGIANQRETVVLWRRDTGRPACPAVVWQDVRGKAVTDRLSAHAQAVREASGLPLSPYFSAAKIAAVLDASPALLQAARAGSLCAGTMDSYLLYRLTGGKVFATDVSNASRTQLMNLRTLAWDADLLALFGIPRAMLADNILPSDACFGHTAAPGLPQGIPIHALLGDSHASFFGHGCHAPGDVKTSYGTGSSIMMNVGIAPLASSHGLSSSVGFGFAGKTCYVLEGNITCSADTLVWLRDEVGLIRDIGAIEAEAGRVPDTQGVYLVPAFSGLGTPYYDENARALLFGMNRGTTRAHILRAALASIAHQNADVLDAMRLDSGRAIRVLKADGGGSVNALLMQMQSDYVPCRVDCIAEKDLTLLGAGCMAALAAGLVKEHAPPAPARSYTPQVDGAERARERAGWAGAVRRAQ